MGKNLKYGEFTFSESKARPTSKGYAKGGKATVKREPEAMVKREVALLSKAGAPKALIKHEEREIKGGKDTPATKKSEVALLKKSKAPLSMIKHEMEEPEAMVRKEVALLKKAGAPKAILEHEVREMSAPSAMKKGGKACAITSKMKKGGMAEAKLEKHANMPASKAHGPGAGARLKKGGVPVHSRVPKIARMK